MTKNEQLDLHDPSLYLNRELSWLEFNDRVLEEGLSTSVPPMERLKFLSIVSSNLDEFFMIRVAGLKQQVKAGVTAVEVSGMTAGEQIKAIRDHVIRSTVRQEEGVAGVLQALAANGLEVAGVEKLTKTQLAHLGSYFTSNILPVLTPLAAGELDPFPTLPPRTLNIGVVLQDPKDKDRGALLAVAPIPQSLSRFVQLPAEKGVRLARIEDVIIAHITSVFPGMTILATALFRITRDADVPVDDESVRDLMIVMEEAVRSRRRRDVVRLEISDGADARLLEWLTELFELSPEDIYPVKGMLDCTALMEITRRPGFDDLRDPPWPPQTPRDLLGYANLWEALDNQDVLLFHPYESFEPVLKMVEDAADDPKVLAIKQTLYRTGGESRFIAALERAAENGKQVTVLVELKARFDETHNISWARRLEDAGCQVLYGIARYKTHAKVLLILREGERGIHRYVHLSTGNYHERTARLYADVGFMTSANDIASDASSLFNLLTGYSQDVGWRRLAVAPIGLRQKFIELISREAQVSSLGEPGLIMAKMNSLEDPEMIRALYEASRAGVRIRLNVRGICCLRPGVPGVSENIEVVSIVDRFLEHARMYYFHNAGHSEVFLSSADWMKRNLDGRLEVLFPVKGAEHKRRLLEIMQGYFADNVKARTLTSKGDYKPVRNKEAAFRAQEAFYREALHAAQQPPTRFHPLSRPDSV